MGKPTSRETNSVVLRQAMLRRLPRRLEAKGELQLPAVPALLEHYVKIFEQLWDSIGRKFAPAELDEFRASLSDALTRGYAASASAKVVVSYECDPQPKRSVTWRVVAMAGTLEEEYADWVRTRTLPLFGGNPDAKVMDVARSLGSPVGVSVLDVGAGTGRNALPLAREGFAVDALEPAPALVELLAEAARAEGLPIRIVTGNVLDEGLTLPRSDYRLVVLSEVVSHFRGASQLATLFRVASASLAPGGLLLFNAFLAESGYKPEELARQLSQTMWCTLFTRRDLDVALEGLPFERLADEPAAAYEREHLPDGHYPSTGWFEGWSGGQDLFDLPEDRAPMELRWLLYRKMS